MVTLVCQNCENLFEHANAKKYCPECTTEKRHGTTAYKAVKMIQENPGITYQAVGDALGVSRQRIEHIYNKYIPREKVIHQVKSIDRLAYSIAETAKILGICKNKVCRLVKDGEIPHVRFGQKTIRILASSIEEFIESKKAAVKEETE